jgi:hypothetical protein
MKIEFRTFSTATNPCDKHFIRVGRFFPKYYTRSIFFENIKGVGCVEWYEVDSYNHSREIEYSCKQEVLPDWFKNYKQIGFSEKVENELKKRKWIKQ